MADVGQPRDPVAEWEARVAAQFEALASFAKSSGCALKERGDGVQLADTHDRNFIRAPDESIIAIDVQPRLLPGHDFDAVIEAPSM